MIKITGLRRVLFFVLLPMIGCAASSTDLPQSVGSATMLANGTIILHLRGETDGKIAESQFQILPTDSRYADIVKHVGGLRPGEEKSVPPWPAQDEHGKQKVEKDQGH